MRISRKSAKTNPLWMETRLFIGIRFQALKRVRSSSRKQRLKLIDLQHSLKILIRPKQIAQTINQDLILSLSKKKLYYTSIKRTKTMKKKLCIEVNTNASPSIIHDLHADIAAKASSSELMTLHGVKEAHPDFMVDFAAFLCNNDKEFACGACACVNY